jgi:phenylalanyl-tRNA synthetase beta chain
VREEFPGEGGPVWTVAIPSWRDDLDRPIDLVEEVLRLFGTERIPPARVLSPGLVGDDDPAVRFVRRATDYLVGHDFHECVNLTLRGGREISTWVSQTAAAELALANPFVEDQSHLRPSLIMGLLETLRLNQSRGVPAARLAETGRVFIERNGQNFECVAAAFLIAEDAVRRWHRREPADFYTTKHHVEALAAAAGVEFARQPPAAASDSYYGWQEGHSAVVGDMQDGWTARFGLLNLAMVRDLGVTGQVYAGVFAVLPEKLAQGAGRRRHRDFSLFPPALRDLALVVDEATPADEVRRAVARLARAAAGSLAVEAVEIFDVYRGEGLPPGKKSVAFSLVFRSAERTLTDDEVNAVLQKIQAEVAQTGPFRVRQ